MAPRLRQTKRPLPAKDGPRVREWWVENDLGDGWRVAHRILIQDGLPIVGEVRVYPAEKGAQAGRWSAEHLGEAATSPKGGVTGRLLQRVRIDDARETFDDMRRRRLLLGTPALPDLARIRHDATHNPGRGGHPDAFYAAVAAAYLAKLHAGATTPTDALADDLNLRPQRLRDLLRAARTRGLLTQPPRGRAGGELTPAGQAALTIWNTPDPGGAP
jgi:hypothetical protein